MDEEWVDVDMGNPGLEVPSRAEEERGWAFEAVERKAPAQPTSNDGSRPRTSIPPDHLQDLYRSIKETASKRLAPGQPIFKIAKDDAGKKIKIASSFFDHLRYKYQRDMNCSHCMRFMSRHGDLVTVDVETGDLVPVFWDASDLGMLPMPLDVQKGNIFREAVGAVQGQFVGRQVGREFKVTGKYANIGNETAGGFKHMHYEFPAARIAPESLKGFEYTATEDLAEMLDRVLYQNSKETVNHVAKLFMEDKLPYAAEHKAPIKWLRDLVDNGKLERATTPVKRHNLLFHYAASSFVGCIHQLRSGALSTVLENVGAGLPFAHVNRVWQSLANPHQYMRPQAAPSRGQITSAERMFAMAGLTQNDMRRRFLTTSEVPDHAFLYRHRESDSSPKPGVFGGIVPKDKKGKNEQKQAVRDENVPPTPISFLKFATEILPQAKLVECKTEEVWDVYFFITGLPGTQPLMEWHDDENLVSWYTRRESMSTKGIQAGWNRVAGIVAFPHLWQGVKDGKPIVPANFAEEAANRHRRHGTRYLVQLDGIVERTNSGLALFPTLLMGRLHGVRSTIEAYSQAGKIEYGLDENGGHLPFVGGIEIAHGDLARGDTRAHLQFRVTDQQGAVDVYKLALFS